MSGRFVPSITQRPLRLRAAVAAALGIALPALLLPAAHAQDADGAEMSEVVVTGSRIVRRDLTSNTPITTVEQDIIQNTGSFALESKLLQLPQFAGAANSQYSTGYFNSGAATLNLRNLGDNRNLVLLDGRRLQPSTAALAIDINTIPSALIENIEVITGGASAVYGADAVSGVVNFKLKRNFEGVQLDAYYGLSERGDNQIVDLSGVFGGNFADGRGNAVLGVTYSDRGRVSNIDIPFNQRGYAVGAIPSSSSFLASGYYAPVANQPSQAALNAYFGQFGAPPGAVGRATQIGFNNDQTSLFNITGANIYNYRNPLYPRYAIDSFTNATRTVKQNFGADTLASLPLTRYSAFGKVDFEVFDGVNAYSQVMYTRYNSTTAGGAPVAASSWSVLVPRDGAHPVPASLAALLDSRPQPGAPWQANKDLTYMGLGVVDHTNDVFQISAGLRGSIGDTGLTWDVNASHGETQLVDNGVSGFASLARYTELMLAPNYGANYAGRYGECTSGLNPFGEQNGVGAGQFAANNNLPQVSADCIDYLNPYWTSTTRLKQDIIEASLQGKAFELPAGEARFAAGIGYRSNTVQSRPDKAFTPDAGYFADIIGQFGVLPVGGTNDVREVFGELLLPVVRDLPFMQLLELNAAYRFSDYNNAGGNSTYKLDANWQVIDAVRVRGGYQRAVRAPNVVEQFGPPTLVFDSAVDACQSNVASSYANIAGNPNRTAVQTLCRTLMGAGAPPITDPVNDPRGLNTYLGSNSGALNSYPSGNRDLAPEKADTWTAGLVWQPQFDLPANARFSTSLDYYNIDIKGAIGYINANLTYQLCFNANGTSNPTYDPANIYCQTVGRSQVPGSLAVPTGVFSTYLNQGAIRTSGVDLQANVKFDAGPGTAGVSTVVNYLDSFKRRVGPGAPLLEYTGFSGGYYEYKAFTTFSYQVGALDAGVRWRYLPGVKPQDYLVAPCTATRCFADTASYNAFDLYGTYRLTDSLSLRAGVDNLLDREPPVTRGIPGSTDVQNYDIIGRRYFLAVSAKL